MPAACAPASAWAWSHVTWRGVAAVTFGLAGAAPAPQAESARATLEEQVDLARSALKEAERRDREDARAKGGEGARVVRSEGAKAAYWDLERLAKEVEAKKAEIAAVGERLEALQQTERAVVEEARARKEELRASLEGEMAERRAALEGELARREEQARQRLEEQARLRQLLEPPPAAPLPASGNRILEDLSAEIRRGSAASSAAPDSESARLEKAAAKATAQVPAAARRVPAAERLTRS